jgi:hypothetical protein
VVTLRQTAAKNPDLIEDFVKSIVESIDIFKSNKAKSLSALRRYMKGADEEILEESYPHTRATLDEAPFPSLQVVKQGTGHVVAAVSPSQAGRRQSDHRPVVREAHRRFRIHSRAL